MYDTWLDFGDGDADRDGLGGCTLVWGSVFSHDSKVSSILGEEVTSVPVSSDGGGSSSPATGDELTEEFVWGACSLSLIRMASWLSDSSDEACSIIPSISICNDLTQS